MCVHNFSTKLIALLMAVAAFSVAAVFAVSDQEREAVTYPQDKEPAAVIVTAPAAVPTETQEERAVPLYTAADAQALAQMAWGECRGVGDLVTLDGRTITSACQKAATMWVALNRYDAGYEDSIAAVVSAPYQFTGYSAEHPIDDELLSLAYDVLERWSAERRGCTDIGRIIPADYYWFVGDGKYNHFSNEYRSGVYYAWELFDIYTVTDSHKAYID